MSVAYYKPGNWDLGEIKDCQKAEWKGDTMLLCDFEEYAVKLASPSHEIEISHR
jgi:hypothetical protein